MKLAVIVLNYKTPDLTVQCLSSLEPEITAVGQSRVIVIENGSGDGSFARLQGAIAERGWGGWVELVDTGRNLGFTGGNNVAIRRLLETEPVPEYLLLLNSDTLVRTGALRALIDFMNGHPRAGIAGSRLEGPDGEAQGSPFRFHCLAHELDRVLVMGMFSRLAARWTAYAQKPGEAVPVDWVAGASMLLRTEMVAELGGLDEGYFAYYEDMDYCFAARQHGWQTWYVPNSVVIHLEGSSSGLRSDAPAKPPLYWFEGRRRYYLKNFGIAYAVLADALSIFGCMVGAAYAALRPNRAARPGIGLTDWIRHSVFVAGTGR